jgi:hypothetical protein
MINTTNQENITQQQRKVWKIQPRAQYNLQNPQKNRKSQGKEEENLSYPIQTIINGQLLSKEKGRSATSREVLQDVSKMNSVKVCRKDAKKSDMDTALCNRNLCKNKVNIKL